ncbi:MAG: AarF/UbiB family protein [Desulfobacterales bacterium]|nr:AarF/UbiB family protein [Desulfobacterales bacterium]
MFDLTDPELRQFAVNISREASAEKLDALAAAMGDQNFARRMAREIVARTKPQEAIPEVYARYRSVVHDGIAFFLSQVSHERLVALALSQLNLPPDTDTRKRLLELAKRFATLHKLGQLIARNPNIDPAVRKWLIHLENGDYGTPRDKIVARIEHQLEQTGGREQMQIHPFILAEASVGAVVRFDWRPPSSRGQVQGVFKVLKPGIRRQLQEELLILEKTAAFFETRRHHYPFKDFQFLAVFQEVREMLVNEIDLAAEQTYLEEATDFFADLDLIRIPALLPFSSDAMTAMAYLQGPKITDAELSREQRRRLAEALFEALVCRPLFGRQATSLFHGDPHAGNILALEDPATGRLQIGLLDWTLAGHLSRSDRMKTTQLIQAVVKKDLSSIRRAIKALAIDGSWGDPGRRQRFRRQVLNLIHSSAFDELSHMRKTFKLLEALAYEGFVFPADLMLFRKAIFALEGVVEDLCPGFDMDAAVMRHMMALITREIPERFGNLFFPLADRADNYPSLISNSELQSLLVHQYIDAVGASYRRWAEFFWGWGGQPSGRPSRPADSPDTPVKDPEASDNAGS